MTSTHHRAREGLQNAPSDYYPVCLIERARLTGRRGSEAFIPAGGERFYADRPLWRPWPRGGRGGPSIAPARARARRPPGRCPSVPVSGSSHGRHPDTRARARRHGVRALALVHRSGGSRAMRRPTEPGRHRRNGEPAAGPRPTSTWPPSSGGGRKPGRRRGPSRLRPTPAARGGTPTSPIRT